MTKIKKVRTSKLEITKKKMIVIVYLKRHLRRNLKKIQSLFNIRETK